MPSINALHLTDFHQGQSEQKVLWPTVKDRFLKDLDKLHAQSGPWDLVLFTGDLTQRGTAEDFAALDATLGAIWERLARLGSTPALLPVPGNHDLKWPEDSSALQDLRAWHSTPATAEAFFASPTDPRRELVQKAFAFYDAWWRRRAAHPGLEIRHGVLPGEFGATFTKGGLRLALVGLNSSFLQLGSGMKAGDLDVDLRQLLGIHHDPPEWLGTHHAALLLTHHPVEWLHPAARRRFREEVMPPDRFVAHLFGHMHEAALREVAEGGAPPRRGLQGLSLFGLEKVTDVAGAHVERLHGYAALRVEVEGNAGKLTLWPRSLETNEVAEYRRMVPDHRRYDLDNDALVMRFAPTTPFTAPALLPVAPSGPSASVSPSATVRATMTRVLKDASDFDAFCLDYYPDVHRRFTNGMDRVARETILLTQVDAGELLGRLAKR